ncbi:MAG: hypothetical protein GY827_10375 [Cytophagales bacterium]|nr:hypothetical protein [Cytophagales bacterium]
MTQEEFEKFVEKAAIQFQDHQSTYTKWKDDNDVNLLEKQAFYVIDWKNKSVSHVKGLEKLLGWKEDEITLLDLTRNLIHPEDREKLSFLIKEVVSYCFDTPNLGKLVSRFSYRIRKTDGTYLKIMRHSGVYDLDEKGYSYSNFSFLSDITEFDKSKKVGWDFFIEGHDLTELKKRIEKDLKTPVSEREKEVLECLVKGYGNKKIADELFVSTETIKYHKKNLFKKFEVNTTIALLKKASDEEIIVLE